MADNLPQVISREHILAENDMDQSQQQQQSPKGTTPTGQSNMQQQQNLYGGGLNSKKGSIQASTNNQSYNQSKKKIPNADTNSQTATIDIYDENITFKDMKHIKHQVENDVKLLRNRVRMLQMEHERAQKKINETQNKAENLERLKHENNQKFLRQLKEQEIKEAQRSVAKNGITYADLRQQQAKKIQDAKKGLIQAKQIEADQVKENLNENRQKQQRDIQEDQMMKKMKSEKIRIQQYKGIKHVQNYQDKKKNQLKGVQQGRLDDEKRLIYKYESEAQQLEKLEEQLILELQDTQEEEREAFKELEEAMLSASLSKRDRLGSNGMAASVGGASEGTYSQLPGLKPRNGSFIPKTAGLNGSMGLTTGNFNRGPGGVGAMQRTGASNRSGTGNSFANNQFRSSFQHQSVDRSNGGDKMSQKIYQ